MHIELLIEDIVRQTTVLIAQLATSGGVRSPLSRVFDQVFLDLARELEAAGVRRKVAADMFGMALRTYQAKVKRLREELEQEQATLWQLLCKKLESGSVTRAQLERHFRRFEANLVGATLQDMVESGVAYCSGRGEATLYGLTNQGDRALLQRHEAELGSLVWYLVASDGAVTREALLEQLHCDAQLLDRTLQELEADGRLGKDDSRYVARRFEIPPGAVRGWEVAVCDHYRAVTTAIAAKISQTESADVGGGTVSYRIAPDHPQRAEVLEQLAAVRKQANDLWKRVADYNDEHGVEGPHTRVTFYFGQKLVEYEHPGGDVDD